MSSLKFTNQNHWNALEGHLTGGHGERFAFAHTRLLATTIDGPALEVIDIELIDDGDVETDGTGWYISETAIDHLHSGAVIGGYGLVEFHYHQCGPPAFSPTDELGLTPMAEYVIGLLDRPYGAGVFAVDRIHVEHWTNRPGGVSRGTFRSVTVMGDHLRLVNAPIDGRPSRLARQADLLGPRGSATLARLRIAVVGAGGTGSHTAVALAYLGARDVLVLDDDQVELTNLNRLVTAGHADIDTPKNITAQRRMREIDPDIHVRALPALTSEGDHPELDDVDIIIGCVDNDGPRDRLNQISVDTATPYVDIATGVNPDTTPPTVGGRVILVTPNGPCLHCHGELDPAEVSRWAKDPEQQALDRQHGYGSNASNPSVIHLNGLAVHAAMTELVAWISGHRRPAQYLDIDLSGLLATPDSPPGVRISPRRPASPRIGCVGCGSRLSTAMTASSVQRAGTVVEGGDVGLGGEGITAVEDSQE